MSSIMQEKGNLRSKSKYPKPQHIFIWS